MEGLIYMATNKINRKIYIGQTIGTLKRRMLNHFSSALIGKRNTYFHNAIKKYGKENFIFKTLCKAEAKTRELLICYLNIVEDMYIEMYDTFNNGYNSIKGGNNRTYHKDIINKIAKANKGRKHTEETKKKMSIAHSGENNPLYGKKHTIEMKLKISIGRTGIKTGPLSDITKKKIREFHSKGIYKTPYGDFTGAYMAARALNKNYTAIYEWCLNNNKKINKYHVAKSKNIFSINDIGKTFKEFGFSFEPKKIENVGTGDVLSLDISTNKENSGRCNNAMAS